LRNARHFLLIALQNSEQLEELVLDCKEHIAKKQAASPETVITSQIKAVENEYALIEFGDFWKSEKTQDAVRELEKINSCQLLS
jgi:hypothetical protein